jgi:hypothetical protein
MEAAGKTELVFLEVIGIPSFFMPGLIKEKDPILLDPLLIWLVQSGQNPKQLVRPPKVIFSSYLLLKGL